MAQTPQQLRAQTGTEIGISPWRIVSQDMIDLFADATDDHQFIHTDPERAKATPFGGTIAHGFLTLSLLPALVADLDITLEGAVMGVNYGFDRVRLIQPVRSGSSIRGRFTLAELTEKQPGQWLMRLDVTVEIEGSDKPALKADWLAMQFTEQKG